MYSIQKGIQNKYCQQFQNSLSSEMIDKIWKSFREAGNSLQGRVGKLVINATINQLRILKKNQKFLDRLFDRFKLDKIPQLRVDKQQIDLQDLVIGLAVLSRMTFYQKVQYIFYLTDLDQDGCLDLQQIQNMIQRIEKIFSKQNASGKVQSYSLLYDIAARKAQRNFKQILFLLKKNNIALKNDDSSLITSDQYIQALKQSKDLFIEQKYLPLNLSLVQVLVSFYHYRLLQNNTPYELSIKIHQSNVGEFKDFRKQLYHILNKNQGQQATNLVKYPGKVQIVRNQKIIQSLPPYQKVTDKKSNKVPINKNKNNSSKVHDKNDATYDHKAAQQTLNSYKMKVKKMIQTKMDPRLNVHFQKMIRK